MGNFLYQPVFHRLSSVGYPRSVFEVDNSGSSLELQRHPLYIDTKHMIIVENKVSLFQCIGVE